MAQGIEALVHRLDPRLRAVLHAELAAGNRVAGAAEWPFARVAVVVHMREPFKAGDVGTPDGVSFVPDGQPGYWGPEYRVTVADGGEGVWHVLAGPAEASKRPRAAGRAKR